VVENPNTDSLVAVEKANSCLIAVIPVVAAKSHGADKADPKRSVTKTAEKEEQAACLRSILIMNSVEK
jgi:hypothetical protein